MRIEKFEKKDGSEGQNYWLEEKDIVELMFDQPLEKKRGIYTNYSIQVKWEDKEIYLNLTKGQAKALKMMKDSNGSLTGKKIVGTIYENEYGKHTGVKLL